ncbi:hypothetical protein IMZ48_32295, partial [Candidatus Bathyarchaeota archaeon]|nr:hypothetical protein [Candidatus Bathyarchaeota archaeon]
MLVVDLEGRFDVTRLSCAEADLKHAYVLKPRACLSAEEVRGVIEGGQRWMLYGAHGSKGRGWWGTLVVGGPGGDVSVGWRGWARVEREEGAG